MISRYLRRAPAVVCLIAACDGGAAASRSAPPPPIPGCRDIPPVPHYDAWPRIASPLRQDPLQEAWIQRVVAAMTLEQKVGQMIQAEFDSLYEPSTHRYRLDEIAQYHLGSVIGGGGDAPHQDRHSPLEAWVALADAIWDAAPIVDVPDDHGVTSVRIPLIWAEDMVHNTGPVFGSTLFPHNIGLGATRDTCLAHEIGVETARATRAAGIDWNLGPSLAVSRDDRWGRTYESFSEEPSLVRAMSVAMTTGMLDLRGPTSFEGVLTTAKHFLADGGARSGIDQGVVYSSERDLINIHGQGYFGVIGAGAQIVIAGFFGTPQAGKMVADRRLLDDVLKRKIGFDGIVLSDWNAVGFVAGCRNDDCPQAINAGLDMIMVPRDWKALIANTLAEVRGGIIPRARIDDAVTRILRVKLRAGVFTRPRPSQRPHAGDPTAITPRALARRAVRESLVLLKNNRDVLPLRRDQRILVVGKSADSMQNQTGGWSLTWQGGPAPFPGGVPNENREFPVGQTVLSAIQDVVGANRVTFRADAAGVDLHDYTAVIAVIGEWPYAELYGDIATATGNWRHPDDLSQRTLEHGHRYPEDRTVLQAVAGKGVPVVTILLSGRALYTSAELNLSDAFVAAWLPGTEGGGIADVVFRAPDGQLQPNFTGVLPFSWPRTACQTAVNVGDASYHPLFPYGYGLRYPTHLEIGTLDETPGPASGCPD